MQTDASSDVEGSRRLICDWLNFSELPLSSQLTGNLTREKKYTFQDFYFYKFEINFYFFVGYYCCLVYFTDI
jgi:hypothetical protein